MLIYKYRGGDDTVFKRDVAAIVDNFFWAASAKDLNDPCETFVDFAGLVSQIEHFMKSSGRENNPEARAAYRTLVLPSIEWLIENKNRVGIFSLSKIYTDELMWAHYANCHTGFCIEYDSEMLLKYKSEKRMMIHMHYSDHPPSVTLEDMLLYLNLPKQNAQKFFCEKVLGTKSKRWSYENETRILTNPGPQYHDYRAIKAIYFGLRMPEEKKSILMSRLDGRGIIYNEMYLEEGTYQFNRKQVAAAKG